MLQSRSKRLSTALAAGAALGVSYSYPTIAILALPAYAVMLLAVFEADDSGEAYLLGLCTWGLAAAIGMHWVAFYPDPVLALSGVTMALLIACLMAMAPAVGYRLRANSACATLVVIAVHLGVEWLLAFGPVAFPFGRLGQALAAYWPASGLIAFASEGAASVAVLIGALGIMLAMNRSAAGRIGVLLAAMAFAALHLIPRPQDQAGTGEMGVLIVQPGTDAEEWAYGLPGERLSMMAALTERALSDTTGIIAGIWPESTLRLRADDSGSIEMTLEDTPESNFSYIQDVIDVAADLHIPIMSGAQIILPNGNRYNSVLLIRPDGSFDRYDKMIPVPVAEQARFAGMRLHNGPDYLKGREHVIFEVSGLRIGIAICFETLFLRHAAPLQRQGADLILAVTQDGWWKGDRAAKQHWRFSRSRALETGLDLVQVSVSGISGVWRGTGRQGLSLGVSSQPQTAIIQVGKDTSGRKSPPKDPSGAVALLSFGAVILLWIRNRRQS